MVGALRSPESGEKTCNEQPSKHIPQDQLVGGGHLVTDGGRIKEISVERSILLAIVSKALEKSK